GTRLVHEVAPELGLQPESTFGSTVDLDVRADSSVTKPDLGGTVWGQDGFAISRVCSESLILAHPDKPSTRRAGRREQLHIEVVDGERVVDVQKAAAGSGRPKTQHFPVDPGDLGGDACAFGGQNVGTRAGTGERLRQVNHVPDQSKLLEMRERCLAPPPAAEEHDH